MDKSLEEKIRIARSLGVPDEVIQARLSRSQKPAVVQPQAQQVREDPVISGTQRVSGVLKSLGLGLIPQAAGAAYETVRAGANALGDKTAYGVTPEGRPIRQNPFLTEEDLAKYQDPRSAVMEGGLNTANAMASVLPLGQGGILARLGLGAGQGALQEAGSNETADVGDLGRSAGLSAILNALIPGGSRLLTKGLGAAAFGKGGSKLPELVREVGPIVGGKDKIYKKTAEPLESKLQDLLGEGTPMSQRQVFGTRQPSGARSGGIFEKASSLESTGMEENKTVKDYLSSLLRAVGEQEGLINAPTADIPLSRWQSLIRTIDEDVPPREWLKAESKKSKNLKAIRGTLRTAVKEKTPNPKEYDRLMGLKQAAAEINAPPKGTLANILSLLRQVSPLGVAGLGGTFGGPLGLGLGLAGAGLTRPTAASAIISLLESMPADVVRSLVTRGGTAAGSDIIEGEVQ